MEWIPRSLNKESDLLSHVIYQDDWAISDYIFCRLEHLWGPHSKDRFADHLNCKLPRFNSKYWVPGSENGTVLLVIGNMITTTHVPWLVLSPERFFT